MLQIVDNINNVNVIYIQTIKIYVKQFPKSLLFLLVSKIYHDDAILSQFLLK